MSRKKSPPGIVQSRITRTIIDPGPYSFTCGHYEYAGEFSLPLSIDCKEEKSAPFLIGHFSFADKQEWQMIFSRKHEIPSTQETAYLRIQSYCNFGHVLKSQHCDCEWQKVAALNYINEHGGILLIGHHQNGKGLSLIDHHKVYTAAYKHDIENVYAAYDKCGFAEDYRGYSGVFDILGDLDLASIGLLFATNNPERLDAFRKQGFEAQHVPHYNEFYSKFLEKEYTAKVEKGGHFIDLQ